MKRLCAALLLLVAGATQAGTLVYVPEAGVYIDTDNNRVLPRVAPNVALDPDTGRTVLPGDSHPAQRPPARVARAAPMNCEQLASNIDYLHGTLQYLGEHDPDFPAVHRNWQQQSAAYARRCR